MNHMAMGLMCGLLDRRRWGVALAAALLLVFSQGVANARPGGALWSANSAGTQDRAIAVANDGTTTYLLVSNAGVNLAEIRRYNASGTLLGTITISGLQRLNLTSLAISGSTAFVAGEASGDPIVRAYSLASSQLLWTKAFGGGGRFQRLVVADSRVVLAGTLGSTFYVTSLTTGGSIVWAYRATTTSGASALAAAGGRVVVGGFPNFLVRTFNATTGTLAFEDSVPDTSAQVFDLLIAGNRAYATGGAGTPLTRGYDLTANTRLWSRATGGGSGNGHSVAASGTSVFTTGRMTAATSDMFVEALDANTGARTWVDFFNPGEFDVGNQVTVKGARVYAVGLSARANGDEDVVVRAYGAADGYLHWSVLSAEEGNASAAAVTVDANRVYVAGHQPGGAGVISQAFVTAYDATAVGGQFIERLCPRRSKSHTGSVASIVASAGRVFAACMDDAGIGTERSTVRAYDLASGALLWIHDLANGSAATPVIEPRLAITGGQLLAIAITKNAAAGPRIVIRSLDPEGRLGAPVVYWTSSFDSADAISNKTRIAARDGFVVASARRAGAISIWAYDLRSCRSASCLRWTHTLAGAELPWSVSIRSNRAAVGFGGSENAIRSVVFSNLSSGTAQPQVYSAAGEGFVHDAVLTDDAVYSIGTGFRNGHTYYAARQTLGTPTGLAWFDDAPLSLQSPETGQLATMDGWGAAGYGNDRIYGCGFATNFPIPRHLVLRAYNAGGGRVWEASFRKWSGLGSCAAMTATPTRAFVAGSDSADGQLGNFLVASFNAATGQDDWVDRPTSAACSSGGACSANAITAEGDYVVAGGQIGRQGSIRIYSAVCSSHGVEASCP